LRVQLADLVHQFMLLIFGVNRHTRTSGTGLGVGNSAPIMGALV
jgi:hypothetical protein